MSEEEWLPENTDVSDSHSLVKTDLKILDENDLKNLASDIGIRYQPPKSRYQPPTRRPRRQHRKTKLYQPVEKIRDKRRTQYANSLPSKRKGSQLAIEEESQLAIEEESRKANVFGGTNSKKQRAVFGNKFVQSVHRPLDVYKG